MEHEGGRVSVVIPAYNAGRYIRQTVDSVLAQTYRDVECIVVNDGSTDNTRDRLLAYGARIVYLEQENRGRAAARNTGLTRASGDYVAFLDADDYWAGDKLQKQAALLDSDPALGVVGCGAYMVAEDGTVVRELHGAPGPRLPAGDDGFAQLVTLEYTIAAPLSTLLIRRHCLELAGGFDKTINTAEEWDLLLRLVWDWDIGCILEPLTFYRGYGAHVPSRVAPRQRQDKYVEVVRRAFEHLEDSGRHSGLRRRAMGLAHLRGALTDMAVGNVDKGAERLCWAWDADPVIFRGREPRFVQILAYFSTSLYDTTTPLDESLAFVNLVFQNLPVSLSQLAATKAIVSDLVFKIHTFDSYQRGDLGAVRVVLKRALTTDRSLLRARGLRSVFVESLVGPVWASRLRRAVHAVAAEPVPTRGQAPS